MVSGLIVTTVLLSTVNLCLCQEDTVTVKIDQGELRGKVANTINGFKYYSFQGIPYAKPPVGSLRFKSPQPADPWDGVRDALEVGSICPQYISGAAGDEDCLFVNVVTPLLPDNETTELKPVMVSIHGGGFTMGFGSLTWNGPYFFVEEDVIFVSMNYRLGALGFLSTGDSVIPGNNGLKDQTLALRWVQQNIAKFGGNPDNVTIFGISAGGCSVHHLVLSPLTKGLFHKAIAQSGSALNYWGYEEPDIARTKTEKFCEFLGNASTDSNEMAEFLRSLSIEEILVATEYLTGTQNNQLLSPNYFELTAERDVEEGEAVFLKDAPINTIISGNFNQVPFISGTVTHEGSIMFDAILWNSTALAIYDAYPELMVPIDLQIHLSPEEITALGKEIKQFYFGNEPITLDKLVQVTNLGTDFIILAGVDRHVSLHAEVSKAPVYQYLFSFNGRWGMVKSSRGDSFPAVGHGDDMDYFYYNSGLQYDFNSMEYTTLKRIVKMWTNFAKTGNPTPVSDPLLQNVTWSPVTALDNFYLEIGNDLIVKRNLENDRMSFWKDIYTRVIGS